MIVVPTAAGSPLKRSIQKAWLSTITGTAPGARSSSGRKNRPAAGRVPSTSKKVPDTSVAYTSSVVAPSLRLIACGWKLIADIRSNSVLRSRKRRKQRIAEVVEPLATHAAADIDDALGLGDADAGPEQHRVGQAEDRRARGDADGERQDRRQAEEGSFSQDSDRMAEIAEESHAGIGLKPDDEMFPTPKSQIHNSQGELGPSGESLASCALR